MVKVRANLLVCSMIASTISTMAPMTSAAAAPLYGSLSPSNPVRAIDTRQTGQHLVPGVARALVAGAAQTITLVTRGDVRGAASVHQCGTPPDFTTVDLVVDHSDYNGSSPGLPAPPFTVQNLVVPDEFSAPCITSTIAADLIVDVVGTLNSSGPGYVPLAQPVAQFSARVTNGGIVASMPNNASGTQVSPVWLLAASSDYPFPMPVTVYPCDGPSPSSTTAALGSTTVVYPTADTQCVYIPSNVGVDLSIMLIGYLDSAASPGVNRLPQVQFGLTEHLPPGLVAQGPERLLDTREAGVEPARLTHESDRVLDLASTIPSYASAVTFNLTVTGAIDDGYVTAYPCSTGLPRTSSINFAVAQTVANLLTVALPDDNRVCFHLYGRVHIVVDLAGYFAYDAGSGFEPRIAERLLDTRATRHVNSGEVIKVRPADTAPPPSAAADAVSLNITATRAGGDGFVTAFPCGNAVPRASTVNFTRGSTVPNSAVVKLGVGGEVCIYAYVDVDVIVDLMGYFDPNVESGIEAIAPERLVDSRPEPIGAQAGSPTPVVVVPQVGVPSIGTVAGLVNITATGSAQDGFITAHPCGIAAPNASNVNWVAGQTAANSATVLLDSRGIMCLTPYVLTDYIVDLVGYVTSVGPLEVQPVLRH